MGVPRPQGALICGVRTGITTCIWGWTEKGNARASRVCADFPSVTAPDGCEMARPQVWTGSVLDARPSRHGVTGVRVILVGYG